jgi:hypothetical protein
VISRIAGFHSEYGFSLVYMRMMMLAAVVYLMAGLWLLYLFLTHFFSRTVSLITVILLLFGTNLFYYSLIDGMMSHVYSFFLFALFLFSWQTFLEKRSYRYFLVTACSLGLAILVRPTNALLIAVLLLWNTGDRVSVMHRIRELLRPVYLLPLLLIPAIIMIPQLVYWHYLTGHWLHFSYRDEGFTNILNPRVAEVLFSPLNGLFTWTPLALFMVLGIVLMLLKGMQNRRIILLLFVMVTMISASWKMWYFGCSLGQRPFIEYFTLFAIPLAGFLTLLAQIRRLLPAVLLVFLLLFSVYFNLRFSVALYRHDRCYYGSTWDWSYYRRLLGKAGIVYTDQKMTSFRNDFENLAIYPGLKPATRYTRSGQYAVAVLPKQTTPLYEVPINDFGYPLPSELMVETWLFAPGSKSDEVSIDLQVLRKDSLLFTCRIPADRALQSPGRWHGFRGDYVVPAIGDTGLLMKLVVRNGTPDTLYADDLSIGFAYSPN